MIKSCLNLLLIAGLFFLAGCSTPGKLNDGKKIKPIAGLRFLDEYDFTHHAAFQQTIVGGLSGIDYDRKKDQYYMICDDPGAFGPSRFYTAKIFLSDSRIDSVRLVGMTPLLNAAGSGYSDYRKDRVHSLDGEALRLDTKSGNLVYSSEGQRYQNNGGVLEIQQPTICISSVSGLFKDSFQLPANLRFNKSENGPRHNSVFEGLDFTLDQKSLFVSLEEPLYEDGPTAGSGDSTAWIRIAKFDLRTLAPVAQYAYQVDPVPYAPIPAGALRINGVSDILVVGTDQLLVIERAFSTGHEGTSTRIYMADAADATDISSIGSLNPGATFQPLKKKLLFNMSALGRYIDNVEGVSFGPDLPNGHQTLLFIVDDNFSAAEKGQLLFFEILP